MMIGCFVHMQIFPNDDHDDYGVSHIECENSVDADIP